MEIFVQTIGWAGTLLVVLAYFLVSSNKISAHGKTYEMMNLLGAIGIGINAFSKYAWPSFGLQIIWSTIAVIFLLRIWHEKRQKIDILFVCQGNMFRSQVAEAVYRKNKGKNVVSAGIYPVIENHQGKKLGKIMPPDFFRAVEDVVGVDIKKYICKELTPNMVKKAKKVVVMANPDIWPDFLKNRKNIIFWEVENPDVSYYEKYASIIKIIEEKVLTLQKTKKH